MLARTPIEDILFDKETIISWLASKDPNEKYNYFDSKECAFANFLIVHGVEPNKFYNSQHNNGRRDCIPPGVWVEIVNADGPDCTYGKALNRAKELLK